MARKSSGTTTEVTKALTLGKPTNIDGSMDINLVPTTFKKFAEVSVLKPGGQLHALLHSNTKEKEVVNPGSSILNFVAAMLNGTLGGTGLSPDGSIEWCQANYTKVTQVYPEFGKYILQVRPHASGRTGLDLYTLPISSWMQIIGARHALIVASQKAGAHNKLRVTRPPKAEKPDTVQVVF